MDSENINDNTLRKKAEEILQNRFNQIDNQSADIDEVIHDLRVHQIELEIQNEELREAQIKLKDSRRKYFDLYNFAPVGYFSLDINGIILESNLTGASLLGIGRANLQKTAFIQYISRDFRNLFHHIIKKAKSTGTRQTIELKLLKPDNYSFYVFLEIIIFHDKIGNFQKIRITATDISELKNAEAALNESEDYREIFDNDHTVMILIDPNNGNIIDANPAAIKFYGYNHQELVKMKISDINVSDVDFVNEEMQKAASRIENHFIFKHRLSNGNIRDVDVYSGLIHQKGKNVLYSLIHDITSQKKNELKINRHAKVLEAINQVFQESLISETEKDVIIKCLEVAEKLTGSEFGFFGEVNENGRLDDRVLSPPAWNVCETVNANKLLKNMEIRSYWGRTIIEEKSQIVNDPKSDLDYLGLPEGHPRITSFLGVPLKEGGKTIGMIGLANKKVGYNEEDKVDVEAISVAFVEALMRKRAEIQLKGNIKNLAQSNKELEQFAYVTSHDLREPLRMISSFLQLLERRYADKLDEDANDFIGFAVDGAKRLDDMINDLLIYSQVNSKRRELSSVKLEEILEETLINLKVAIDENNVVITHDHLPIIYGNDKSMIQLFQNLIGNAIKYRSEETPKIDISVKKEDKHYLFSIKDNGIGIEPKHLDRIFTIFQRLHSDREYEGTGIGLAIAQKIVIQHGGKIWAESELGKGSTFYFTIPT
jgi:PAS domain S-box-containing protein